MKIIYLDDEIILLNYFETIIKNIKEITSYKLFSDSDKAIEYIKYEKVDIVFLDISMPKINGIEVAKIIRKFDKIVNIVFITSFEEYAIKAFDVEAKGYILKPFDEADIRKEVNKVYKNKRMDLNERVFIKTFGRFDVFVDGLAIHFKSSKSKELLALLVDNQGGVITMEVAISILW